MFTLEPALDRDETHKLANKLYEEFRDMDDPPRFEVVHTPEKDHCYWSLDVHNYYGDVRDAVEFFVKGYCAAIHT